VSVAATATTGTGYTCTIRVTWFRSPADASHIKKKMEVLRMLGAPYTDQQIENAPADLEGKTEQDALIAYLQGLGTAIKTRR
jgi:cytochrome c oxidase cbb3-type subunit 2